MNFGIRLATALSFCYVGYASAQPLLVPIAASQCKAYRVSNFLPANWKENFKILDDAVKQKYQEALTICSEASDADLEEVCKASCDSRITLNQKIATRFASFKRCRQLLETAFGVQVKLDAARFANDRRLMIRHSQLSALVTELATKDFGLFLHSEFPHDEGGGCLNANSKVNGCAINTLNTAYKENCAAMGAHAPVKIKLPSTLNQNGADYDTKKFCETMSAASRDLNIGAFNLPGCQKPSSSAPKCTAILGVAQFVSGGPGGQFACNPAAFVCDAYHSAKVAILPKFNSCPCECIPLFK